MMIDNQDGIFESRVTYTLHLNGRFYLIENVPARVTKETGEQLFSVSTVKRLQQIILSGKEPERVIETWVVELTVTPASPSRDRYNSQQTTIQLCQLWRLM